MAGQGAEHTSDVAPEEETVGQRIRSRFRSAEFNLVEEITAVRQTGLADPRLTAICLTQLELAFLALHKAIDMGSRPPPFPTTNPNG